MHSHLDKGASLADWMRIKQHQSSNADVGVSQSLQQGNDQHKPLPRPNGHVFGVQYPESATPDSGTEVIEDDEDEYGGSLTRQLAETAVGVREMSKQLGRSYLPKINDL